MKYKPHEYQTFATDFILNNPIVAILLEMGLGKSVITLTAINDLLFDSFEIIKVLVIAPLRVARDTWTAELAKWEHLENIRASVVIGTEKQRREALMAGADIYLINRENVKWLVENFTFDFDMVVIDELSSFKDHGSQRFKALRKVRPNVRRIVGLTGTPTPNGLMDLWAEIGILDMGQRLGRFIGGYRERYFLPDKRNQTTIFSYKPREGAEEAIYEKISDICISMKSMDYLQMPECVLNNVEVAMSAEEADLYERLKKDMILPFEDGDIDAKSSVGLSNKLLQMANGAVYDETGSAKQIHDRKLDALEDLIEASNGKPVLIAYWFKHDLQRICERFPVVKLDTSADIAKWNAGEIPIAIIHPASAGHGLNLQVGGSTLIWFGLTWSLELYQQTNARLWRQGQKNTVVIYHIITKETIDENVLRALNGKENTQAALIEAVKANLYSEGENHNE
ncbi:MAG: DEAD/DEAH box helicase [Clostridia bacterium]|nr:DEAD/DEAH box helicase [Clostridia bacterium]